jgi:hypothetical protein
MTPTITQLAVATESKRKLSPAGQPPKACRDITTLLGSTKNSRRTT